MYDNVAKNNINFMQIFYKAMEMPGIQVASSHDAKKGKCS